MPQCKRCGNDHFNFQKCPPAKAKQQPVDIRFRKDQPEGFTVSGRWGNSTGVFSGATIYQLPPRQRTGSLIGPDGNTYTPEPLPPEAA